MPLRQLMACRLIANPLRSVTGLRVVRGLRLGGAARRVSPRSRADPCRPGNRYILLIRHSQARSAPSLAAASAAGLRADPGMQRQADGSRMVLRRPRQGPRPERMRPEPLARRAPRRVREPRRVLAPRQVLAVRQVPARRDFLVIRGHAAPSTADTHR